MLYELTEKEFDEFSIKHPLTSFQQTSGWAKVKAKNGWGHHFYALKENDNIVAATLVLYKTFYGLFKMYYAPRGMLIDFENTELLKEFTDEIVAKVKSEGGMCFKIDPYVEDQQYDVYGNPVENGYDNRHLIDVLKRLGYEEQLDKNGYPQTTMLHTVYVLDVEGKSEEELLKACESSTKQRIRSYKKSGVTIRELERDELSKFNDLMNLTSKRKAFENRSLSYYEDIYDTFHEDGYVKFIVAEVDVDETIARYEQLKADSEAQIEKLLIKKQNHPNDFNGEGQIKEMENRISSSIRKIEETKRLKAQYGNPIILSGNMDFFWGDREVVSVYGGNNEELFMFNSAYAVYFEMIAYAAKNGYKRFNFYGIPNNPQDTNDETYGVYEHKRGYNGRVERYIGEFDYPVKKMIYRLYKTLLAIRNR